MSKICFKIIRGRNMLREQRWNATNIGLINYWSWGMSTQGLITWLLTFWELKFFHKKFLENRAKRRTSLVVQWLRLCTATAEGAGSIPAQGTKSLYVTWLWPKKKKKEQEEMENRTKSRRLVQEDQHSKSKTSNKRDKENERRSIKKKSSQNWRIQVSTLKKHNKDLVQWVKKDTNQGISLWNFRRGKGKGLYKLSFRENTAQKRIKNQNDFRLGGKLFLI